MSTPLGRGALMENWPTIKAEALSGRAAAFVNDLATKLAESNTRKPEPTLSEDARQKL